MSTILCPKFLVTVILSEAARCAAQSKNPFSGIDPAKGILRLALLRNGSLRMTISKRLFRIEQDRHRPVVDELDLHHLLKAAGLAAQAERANAFDKVFIELARLLRPRSIVE